MPTGALGHIAIKGIEPLDAVAVVVENLLATVQVAKTFFAAVGYDHHAGVQAVFVLYPPQASLLFQ